MNGFRCPALQDSERLMNAHTLVVGYGNSLRRDDAVGLHVADAVWQLGLPGVRVISVQQLTPELAVALAEAPRAIFVDASADRTNASVEASPLHPCAAESISGHISNPGAL